MNKDFAIYEAMKAEALRVFEHVTARPGAYSLADLIKINNVKKAEAAGIAWAKGYDVDAIINIDVEGFKCSYPNSLAFAFANQFEKFAGVPVSERASFIREDSAKGAPVFSFTVDALSVDSLCACDKASERIALTGCYIDVINKNIVATNGHALNVTRCHDLTIFNAPALKVEKYSRKSAGVILTAEFMKKAKGQSVTIYAEGSSDEMKYKAVATNGAACDCMEARYPNYLGVFANINEGQGVRFTKNIKALIRAAKAIAKNNDVNRVVFSGVTGENFITISCRDIYGKNELTKPVPTAAPLAFTFSFGAKIETINGLNCGAYDTIYFNAESRPAVLSGAEGVGLLMPLYHGDADTVTDTTASEFARKNATNKTYNSTTDPLTYFNFVAPAAELEAWENVTAPAPAVDVVPTTTNEAPAPAVDETNEAPHVEPVNEAPAPAVDVVPTTTNEAPAPAVVVDVVPAPAVDETNEAPHADKFERFINSLNKRDGGRARDILTKYETRDGVSRQRYAYVLEAGAKYSVDYFTNNNGTRARLEYIAINAEGKRYICTKYEFLFAEFLGVAICTPEYKEYIHAEINYINITRQRDGWQFVGYLDKIRENLARYEARNWNTNEAIKEKEYLRAVLAAADALARFKDSKPSEFLSVEPENNEGSAPAADVVTTDSLTNEAPAPAVDVVTTDSLTNEAPAPAVDVVPTTTNEAPAPAVDVVPTTTNEAPAPAVVVVDTLTTDSLTADPEPVNEAPAVVVDDETNEDSPAPAVVVVDTLTTDSLTNEAPALTLRARHWLTVAAVMLCAFILRAVVNIDTNAHEDNAPRPAVVVVDTITTDSLTAHADSFTTDSLTAHADSFTTDSLTAHADSLTNEAPAPAVDDMKPAPRPHALSPEPDALPLHPHIDSKNGSTEPLHAAALPFLFPLLFIGRAKNHRIAHYSAFSKSQKNILRTLSALVQSFRDFMNRKHDFSNEEGEILLTGWQYLCFILGTCAAAVLLSIQF